ncbi:MULTISPECIES: lantibiotic immunity ABC transporter MutE/EpiE family permease subunit [Alkalihalobacterium]|uniref:Lantibiotic immunity ABC transporter MutE/EpiE family permease subunit n=1 Tax=Alkalihalobacterium chitinilyticum TaxID=2980103 RepID=A0ABT5VLF2_9BACI|nr:MULTISPECIES: lantibiotic immunity ABC transporter MutE/EpiE family permease subunit [Alkalihalobacterium]MDE5415303.1 lantibiotic immunity ABC transporter MutE/EpiE family permease subunit [Alkalihalobacterium chitinilyticum]
MILDIKSEVLKTKRTKMRKMLFIIPLICAFLALSFNFLGGPEIIRLSVETIINHWGIIWLSVFIAAVAGLLNNLEKKSTRFKTTVGLPVNLGKRELTRIVFLVGFTFLASIFLIVIMTITSFVIESPFLVPLSLCILAVLLTFITSLWQIPFCLWLSRKTNFFFTLLFNSMLNLNLGTLFAPTEDWWLVPYAWHLRVQMPLTKLHSNGIPLPEDSELLSFSVIPVAITISLLLFFLLTLLAVWSFRKLEVR